MTVTCRNGRLERNSVYFPAPANTFAVFAFAIRCCAPQQRIAHNAMISLSKSAPGTAKRAKNTSKLENSLLFSLIAANSTGEIPPVYCAPANPAPASQRQALSNFVWPPRTALMPRSRRRFARRLRATAPLVNGCVTGLINSDGCAAFWGFSHETCLPRNRFVTGLRECFVRSRHADPSASASATGAGQGPDRQISRR